MVRLNLITYVLGVLLLYGFRSYPCLLSLDMLIISFVYLLPALMGSPRRFFCAHVYVI